MTTIGTDTFRVPVFITEGNGINLSQDGVVQALTISVNEDILADLLDSDVITTDYQESVRLILTANATLSGTQTLQSVALVAGDRVLPTAQSTAANNRIWVVQDLDWTIAEGWDVADTISSGTVVPCEEGTNAGRIAVLTTANPITLGTSPLTWDINETDAVFISNFIGRNAGASGTTSLTLPYAKNWVFATRSGAQTFRIVANATAAHTIGTEIVIQHDGSGTKTIETSGGSVSLNGTGGGSVTLTARGDAYLLKKKSANAWTATPMKTSGATLADGDYGDITASSSGTVLTIDNDAVTYAKMQNVSATDMLLGRSTSGAGNVEEIACTAAGRALLDDANAAAQRTTLGAAATSQTDFISGIIASPSDTDYRLVVKIPYACTITETVTRSTAGTATATFKINTTALGGTANSVSTSEQAQTHASNNSVAVDDDIVLTISANSSSANLSFLIKFTRTLA